jgi:hypothetical protein
MSGPDAEVAPEEQALALRNLELVGIVGHAVGEAGLFRGDAAAVAAQLEAGEVAVPTSRPATSTRTRRRKS